MELARRKKGKMKQDLEQRAEDARAERKEEIEEALLQDPLEVLGMDIMLIILSSLDARSLALSLLVSHTWYLIAGCDRLWSSKCKELWLAKAHVPRSSLKRGLSKMAAYSTSMEDGNRRRIMRDDLCDHVWKFHFNQAAPEYWRNLDPYWNGTNPFMRRYFHPDGSLTADPGDKVWGGHESCHTVVTSLVGDGKIREHYVRINKRPGMSVFRNPDWSWRMSNNFFCYSSIPDSDKEGGTGPLFPLIDGTPLYLPL